MNKINNRARVEDLDVPSWEILLQGRIMVAVIRIYNV